MGKEEGKKIVEELANVVPQQTSPPEIWLVKQGTTWVVKKLDISSLQELFGVYSDLRQLLIDHPHIALVKK